MYGLFHQSQVHDGGKAFTLAWDDDDSNRMQQPRAHLLPSEAECALRRQRNEAERLSRVPLPKPELCRSNPHECTPSPTVDLSAVANMLWHGGLDATPEGGSATVAESSWLARVAGEESWLRSVRDTLPCKVQITGTQTRVDSDSHGSIVSEYGQRLGGCVWRQHTILRVDLPPMTSCIEEVVLQLHMQDQGYCDTCKTSSAVCSNRMAGERTLHVPSLGTSIHCAI